MNRVILFLLIATITIAAKSQYSYFLGIETNLPRPGDNVSKQKISWHGNLFESGERVWDFSRINITEEAPVMKVRSLGDSALIVSERLERVIMKLNGDSLMKISAMSPDKKLDYNLPEPMMYYGLDDDKRLSSFFYSEGSLDCRRYLRQAGISSIEIVSRGKMITPELDSIRNVILMRTVRCGTSGISDVDSCSFARKRDNSILSQDSIWRYLVTDSLTHVLETYSWWACGYRYPVIETSRLVSYFNSVAVDSVKSAFYTSPRIQVEDLAYDEENEALRQWDQSLPFDNSYNEINHVNGRNNGLGCFEGHNSLCDVFPSAVETSTNISYSTGANDVLVTVNSCTGVQYQKIYLPGGSVNYSLDMSSLSRGWYVVTAVMGDEFFSFRVLKL